MWKNCQTAIGRGRCIVIILIVLFIVSIASAEVTNEKTITVEGVTIYDYGTAKNITHNEPTNVTNNFTTSDHTIYFWISLSVHRLGNKLTLRLYSPDGRLFVEHSNINLDVYYVAPTPYFYTTIFRPYFGLNVTKMADKTGKWTIEAYINDKKAITHYFYLHGEPPVRSPIYSPVVGIVLSLLPLSVAIFKIRQNKQKRLKVSLIEGWKIYGTIIMHIIALLWALVLCLSFAFLLKERGFWYVDAPAFLGISLFSASFCFIASKNLKRLLGYRKELSKNLLYLNAALPISISLFVLFLAYEVEALIERVVFIIFLLATPLLTPNFVSLYMTKRYGEILIVKGTEAKIPTSPIFPAELEQYYSDAEYIGSGGFAWVFKATRKDGKKVAIKIPAIKDEKTGAFFLREVANWSALEHENIVKLYSFNIFPVPYLEMELCDGSLGFGKRDLKEAISIIYEVAKGLKHAHEKKIVHADIKHANILIKDGKIKISDWGLSKVKRGKSLSISALTPEYAAPEQILGRIDERTDIWQLGVVFYELVTGKLPFEGKDADVINHVINDEPVPPSEINPDSKCVEHIIMKCLSKRREERYQSMDELLRELENYKPEGETTLSNEKEGERETVEFNK